MSAAAYVEAEHPRGYHGRWIRKLEASAEVGDIQNLSDAFGYWEDAEQGEREDAKQTIMVSLARRLMDDEDFAYAADQLGVFRDGRSTVGSAQMTAAQTAVTRTRRELAEAQRRFDMLRDDEGATQEARAAADAEWARRANVAARAEREWRDLERIFHAENSVDNLIASWATTVADDDTIALMLQRAVAQEFGVPAGHLEEKLHRPSATMDELPPPARELWAGMWHRLADDERVQAGLRSFVRAQYENTQNWLKANGVKEVRLYRGMSFPQTWEYAPDLARFVDVESTNPFPAGFGRTAISMQPASSFAFDFHQANQFTQGVTGEGTRENGAVVATLVPAERILSTARTGWGALIEAEVVVIGGQDDEAYVWGWHPLPVSPEEGPVGSTPKPDSIHGENEFQDMIEIVEGGAPVTTGAMAGRSTPLVVRTYERLQQQSRPQFVELE